MIWNSNLASKTYFTHPSLLLPLTYSVNHSLHYQVIHTFSKDHKDILFDLWTLYDLLYWLFSQALFLIISELLFIFNIDLSLKYSSKHNLSVFFFQIFIFIFFHLEQGLEWISCPNERHYVSHQIIQVQHIRRQKNQGGVIGVWQFWRYWSLNMPTEAFLGNPKFGVWGSIKPYNFCTNNHRTSNDPPN